MLNSFCVNEKGKKNPQTTKEVLLPKLTLSFIASLLKCQGDYFERKLAHSCCTVNKVINI